MPPTRTPRRRSFNEPGQAHELTFHCFQGHQFLSKDRTCEWLSDAIERARMTLDFELWAYVFMPNHVHLIVFPQRPDHSMSAILKAIKEPVSRQAVAYLKRNSPKWLERIAVPRGRRVEHRFWQAGGGYDRNVTEPRTLRSMIDYIHANPVRRGLVELAEDWKWSSAGWYLDCPKHSLRPDLIPHEWLSE